MIATSVSPVALRPEARRSLVLRAATGTIQPNGLLPFDLLEARVKPDLDQRSPALIGLFAIDTISCPLVEWQLMPGVVVPGQPALSDWRFS